MLNLRRILLRPLTSALIKPALQRYLRTERVYRGHGLALHVPPGVFHPGFFFSSGVMASWLAQQPLAGQRLLDVGTGSGLLGLVAAQHGAEVTLLDLSPRALLAAQRNAQRNRLRVRLAHSDGLTQLPPDAQFDWIVANPPWFAAPPPDEAGLAWYAGPHLSWFHDFFGQLASRLSPDGHAMLVLADSADLAAIHRLAARYGWRLTTRYKRRVVWEWQHVLQATRHD